MAARKHSSIRNSEPVFDSRAAVLAGALTGISPQEGSSLLVLLGTSDHAVL